jgi:hypothetical protein
MKKITLFFAALAVAVSASAQWGNVTIGEAGNYDMVSGEWINAVPKANEPFTFAILVTDAAAQTWLSGAEGRTLALGQARVGDESNAQDIRLVPVGENLYAIDISIEQVFGEVSAQEGAATLHFNLTGASIVDDTWVWNAYLYGGINYEVASEDFNDAMQLTGVELITNPSFGVAYPGTISSATTGVSSLNAEKGELVSVEYFSLTGNRLPETANGLVIVKSTFTDGSVSVEKIVK